MKKLILFVTLVFTTALFNSCSNEETESINSIDKNIKVKSYLKSFYSKDFKFGISVKSKLANPSSSSKTIQYQNITVTEVFVDNDTKARGYVVIDNETGSFINFVDVDRIDYKLTSVDIDENNTKIIENIELLQKYYETNEFDFVKYIEEHSNDSNLSKFFGPKTTVSYTEAGNGWCNQYTTTTIYVFWIPVQTTTEYNLVRC